MLKPNAGRTRAALAGALEELPPDEFKRDEYDFPPLPFKPIQEGCPFFADAYETHGKEHAQPLWHLTILATTFLEDGERLAHELGNAHPDYTPDTTQAMWDRKVREREELRPWLARVQSVRECRMHVLQKLPAPRKNQVTVESGCPGNPKRIRSHYEEVKDGKIDPVVAVKKTAQRGADNEAMFSVLNASYAVVKYGGEIVIASIIGNDIILMKVDDFHKMYANVRVRREGVSSR